MGGQQSCWTAPLESPKNAARSHISARHRQCWLAAAPPSGSQLRVRGQFGSTLGFSSFPSRAAVPQKPGFYGCREELESEGRTRSNAEPGEEEKFRVCFCLIEKCLASFPRLPSSSLYSWRGGNESFASNVSVFSVHLWGWSRQARRVRFAEFGCFQAAFTAVVRARASSNIGVKKCLAGFKKTAKVRRRKWLQTRTNLCLRSLNGTGDAWLGSDPMGVRQRTQRVFCREGWLVPTPLTCRHPNCWCNVGLGWDKRKGMFSVVFSCTLKKKVSDRIYIKKSFQNKIH